LFLIPKEDAIKTGLPESADAYNDPGYVAYGLAVYHQIHCLNRIRKTFDAEKHYPNEPQEKLDFHRGKHEPSFPIIVAAYEMSRRLRFAKITVSI
jgi:hypothetical protein